MAGHVDHDVSSRCMLTCFDHNSSRLTNFLASEVVLNAARRDLSIGAESKKFTADFDYDLSRRSCRPKHGAEKHVARQLVASPISSIIT